MNHVITIIDTVDPSENIIDFDERTTFDRKSQIKINSSQKDKQTVRTWP